MTQAQTVFKRYEKKYMLAEEQYTELLQALKGQIQQDSYGKHTICNVYFDTPDDRLIRASIEKPIYKEKLRIRSYGVPGREDAVFVELKKKYDKVVYKRRIQMTLHQAENYLLQEMAAENPCQISKEIDWFMDFYRPVPKMYIAYDRIAFFGKDNPDLRLTFDTDIRWRTTQLSLSKGHGGNALLEEGSHLMELKFSGSMPMWLSATLAQLEIFPVSYSKYGNCYRENLLGSLCPMVCADEERGDICA